MVDLLQIKDSLVFSFNLTYVLMITTGTITLIEALRTKIPLVRHIFNLETVISIIAGYFYGKYVSKINESFECGKPINWGEIVRTRYLDWAITTPLMLLVFMNVLAHHQNHTPKFQVYVVIVLLNYFMLYTGYKGELLKDNNGYYVMSFMAFFLMFGIIYWLYVRPKYVRFNYVLFFVFFVIWSMYGVVYKMDIRTRNIVYNVLDLIAKSFVGIGLWVYFTHLFVI